MVVASQNYSSATKRLGNMTLYEFAKCLRRKPISLATVLYILQLCSYDSTELAYFKVDEVIPRSSPITLSSCDRRGQKGTFNSFTLTLMTNN
jgi:hypothetical protein